ncbi:MAG: acyl-CoA reductase [Flammeovirgaceae bacterium]
MITLENRIDAFVELGKRIQNLSKSEIELLCQLAYNQNTWFDEKQVKFALKGLIELLEEKSLRKWANSYQYSSVSKKVGCVLAGNIPMVGIHDCICVLMSGHELHAKLSSQDSVLIKKVLQILCEIEPNFERFIKFVENLKEVDAVIATGSDNTARYFEYYFAKKPHIIRKNRTSVAILQGDENREDLQKLADDLMLYYGLGCRNVSKIFAPTKYDFSLLLKVLEPIGLEAVKNHKYSNNYDYQKSLLLINKIPHLDNGYFMMREETALFSPISVAFYEYYDSSDALHSKIGALGDKLQCIVSKDAWYPQSVSFGQAQLPKIDDYADRVDTMEFLVKV